MRDLTISETEIETWFERDRAYVALKDKRDEKTLVEWWDGDVWQAIEDGFLSDKDFVLGKLLAGRNRALHESAYEYAQELDLLPKVEPELEADEA